MKKTYLSPDVEFQLMDTEEMIAQSFNSSLKEDEVIDDPNKILSRRSNVWEDENEDF
jgi:hypothetical protein